MSRAWDESRQVCRTCGHTRAEHSWGVGKCRESAIVRLCREQCEYFVSIVRSRA